MGKYTEKIDSLFKKYVKPMGLPPRLAGEVKHAMEGAAKTAKGNTKVVKAAIPAYLEERGYDAKGKKKPKKAKKVKKAKIAKPVAKKLKKAEAKKGKIKKKEKPDADAPDPAKEKAEKTAGKSVTKGDSERGVPRGNIDLTKLDRKTLNGMAKDLGVKKVSKETTDDELRAKVAKKLVGYDSVAHDKLSKASAEKIDAQDNCLGLLIDLSQAACISCPGQVDCRKLFEEHRKNGFKIFDELKPDVPTEALTKKTKKTDDDANVSEGGGTKFDSKAVIEVVPFKKVAKLPTVKVDGEAVESNMEHKTFLRALKEAAPTTLGAFKKVVLAHYDAEDDDPKGKTLASWFVRYCKSLGVLKVS